MPLGFLPLLQAIGRIIPIISLIPGRVYGRALKMEAIIIFGKEKCIMAQEMCPVIAGISGTVSLFVA